MRPGSAGAVDCRAHLLLRVHVLRGLRRAGPAQRVPELWGWVRAPAHSTDARVATGVVAREKQLQPCMIDINSCQISMSESPRGGIRERSTQRVRQLLTSHAAPRTIGYVIPAHGRTPTPPLRHREWSGQRWVACVKSSAEALCRHGQDPSRKHIPPASRRFECQSHNPRTRRERKIL